MTSAKLNAIDQVNGILQSLGSDAGCLPATFLYNEGWMLRLILNAASEGLVEEHIPAINAPAKWASEVKLYTPFDRSRGAACEGPTNADGVVGDFGWAEGTQTGVALLEEASRFEVFEAKMFSSLSRGVTAAKSYDQAVRTVACMAQTLSRNNISPNKDGLQTLRFWVVAPQSQLQRQLFDDELTPVSMRTKARMRIEQFSGQGREELELWYDNYFLPLVQRLERDDALRQVSWEQLIGCISCDIRKQSVEWFYSRCIEAASHHGTSARDNIVRGQYCRAEGPHGGEIVVICNPGSVRSRAFIPGTNQSSFTVENASLIPIERPAGHESMFIPLKGAEYAYEGKQVRVISNGPCRSRIEYLYCPGPTRLVDNHLLWPSLGSSEGKVFEDG